MFETYDDVDEGSRTRYAIPNAFGIVKFEYQYRVENKIPTGWITLPKVDTHMEINPNATNGNYKCYRYIIQYIVSRTVQLICQLAKSQLQKLKGYFRKIKIYNILVYNQDCLAFQLTYICAYVNMSVSK